MLDMDSTEIPVYGEQEQSAYNTHYSSGISFFGTGFMKLYRSWGRL